MVYNICYSPFFYFFSTYSMLFQGTGRRQLTLSKNSLIGRGGFEDEPSGMKIFVIFIFFLKII